MPRNPPAERLPLRPRSQPLERKRGPETRAPRERRAPQVREEETGEAEVTVAAGHVAGVGVEESAGGVPIRL